MFIYERENWTHFTWSDGEISDLLARASFLQGNLLGQLAAFGFEVGKEAGFLALSQEIVKSNEIEGVLLNTDEVRSSVARRLNVDLKKETPPNHFLDGIVDMMLDATRNVDKPLTAERLCAWHAALFPTGYSGLTPIKAGRLRDDAQGEMRVVSYKGSTEIVHYQAPPARDVPSMLDDFCAFMNAQTKMNAFIKAAIAHLWFVSVHPFEDGNGRIARALTEMALAKSERTPFRFYNMSGQIQKERKTYYMILEMTQRGDGDITSWLKWFLKMVGTALTTAQKTVEHLSVKAKFWQAHADEDFSSDQRMILNRLLDGTLRGNLTSSRWAKMCKTSQDTASRQIKILLERNILIQIGAGRSTHYELNSERGCNDGL